MKTLLKLIGVFSVLFLFAFTSFASNDRKTWKKAENYLIAQEYGNAQENYQQIYTKNQDNFNLAFKIGFCYLHSENVEDIDLAIEQLSIAKDHISKSYKDKFAEKDAPVETEYYLGVAYRLQANYTEAIEHFKAFKKYSKRNMKTLTDELIDREIQACEFSMTNPPERFNVQIYNFDVEIPDGDFLRCPVISGNDKVFVYTLGTQNIYPPDFNTDRDMYHLPVDDIYYSVWENNKWSTPEKISDDLNISGYTMPVSLSYDGNVLLLVHDDNDNGNIYMSEFIDGKWSSAKKLNKNINSRKWESHAFLSKESDKLYFTSQRKGGSGDLDLYISEMTEEGNWGIPENLGENINTEFHEEVPFLIDNENQLYFGSEGHGNIGGFDMFVSIFDSVENKWSKPLNLGYPYNTVGNDLAYIVTFQGKFIYCPQNSNKRREGVSQSDCFSLRMPYEDKLVALHGQVYIPEINNEIPMDLKIAAIDPETGETLQVVSPNKDGSFIIEDLIVGKVNLVAMSSDYIEDQSIEINVPRDFSDQNYPLDIYLQASELALKSDEPAEIALVVKHILFDFDKYNIKTEFEQNLSNLADFMIENQDFKIEIQGHTDHYGTNNYNKWLGKMRAQSIKAYLTQKGVNPDNLNIVSFGEEKPIAKKLDADKARRFNRRAMISLMSDSEIIQIQDIEIPEDLKIN